MGKVRGRRVGLVDRVSTLNHIQSARESGSRVASACEASGISTRTFQRWVKYPDGDQRRGPTKEPHNKLCEKERSEIIQVCNSKQYRDKPPSQIVPLLADKGMELPRFCGQCYINNPRRSKKWAEELDLNIFMIQHKF